MCSIYPTDFKFTDKAIKDGECGAVTNLKEAINHLNESFSSIKCKKNTENWVICETDLVLDL